MSTQWRKPVPNRDRWEEPEAILPTKDGRGLVAFSKEALRMIQEYPEMSSEQQEEANEAIPRLVRRVHLDD